MENPSSMKVRIVIAEDHTILRDGLKRILQDVPEWEVVGEAEDGLEAVRITEEMKPDLVLMDLSLPRMNGIGAIQEIRKRRPDTKILVLTVHKTEEYILATLKAGADGYVLKDVCGAELIFAIRAVLSGKCFLSPSISDKMIEAYLDSRRHKPYLSSWDSLTQREREILKMIADGYKTKDIAEYLDIAQRTVRTHRENLMRKLDLHSTASLTAFAMEKGLLSR